MGSIRSSVSVNGAICCVNALIACGHSRGGCRIVSNRRHLAAVCLVLETLKIRGVCGDLACSTQGTSTSAVGTLSKHKRGSSLNRVPSLNVGGNFRSTGTKLGRVINASRASIRGFGRCFLGRIRVVRCQIPGSISLGRCFRIVGSHNRRLRGRRVIGTGLDRRFVKSGASVRGFDHV